jgi:hypothetical protein
MLQTARPNISIADSLSILWWRWVISATRGLNRAVAWAWPVLHPLKPFWWVPIPFTVLGFAFGLAATLILA